MLCGPSAPIGLCTPINHPFVGLADTVDEEIPNNHLECIKNRGKSFFINRMDVGRIFELFEQALIDLRWVIFLTAGFQPITINPNQDSRIPTKSHQVTGVTIH